MVSWTERPQSLVSPLVGALFENQILSIFRTSAPAVPLAQVGSLTTVMLNGQSLLKIAGLAGIA